MQLKIIFLVANGCVFGALGPHADPLNHIIHFIASMSGESKAFGSIRNQIIIRLVVHVKNSRSQGQVIHGHQLVVRTTRLTPRQNTQTPLTLQMLLTLLQALDRISTSNYEIISLKIHFAWHFLRFLRVGDMTSKSLKGQDPDPCGEATLTL